MSDIVTREQMLDWVRAHDLDPNFVRTITIGPNPIIMTAEVAVPHPDGKDATSTLVYRNVRFLPGMETP